MLWISLGDVFVGGLCFCWKLYFFSRSVFNPIPEKKTKTR